MSQNQPVQIKPVQFTWGVKIPMRDGVNINATLYQPGSSSEPLPVIFTFTPYVADRFHHWGVYFARNGYVFAAIDVRGRGNSEGAFEPMVNEGHDGYDIVEWFAAQPFCNGKVTMFGGSYGGFDQWSTLKEFPPHLTTILPVASGYPSLDFPFPRNIMMSYFIQWLTFTSGATSNVNIFGDMQFWAEKYYEMYCNHRPFQELDQIAGNLTTHFQTWLKTHKPTEYWDRMNPKETDYAKITCPILTITGHYDDDQNGAMGFYKKHMAFGNPEAIAQHHLVIGPWDHAGTRLPQKELGGLTFADAGVIDMDALNKGWYDWTMKGKEKPTLLQKRIAYYVMGAEKWKFADSLETISNKTIQYYLHSDGYANDVFHSGWLKTEKPTAEKPDTYIYDPLDIRPGALELNPDPRYLLDQTAVFNLFGNGVVYHSEIFQEDIEITGYVKLNAWIEIDTPDTDFFVTLYEITSNGTSIRLTQDFMRARYRDSLREEKLVKPGEINSYKFDWFTFFSRQVAKGSCLRLVLACPNSIQTEKNYNSGKPVHEECGADARTVHVKIHHDAQHSSYLEIPIVKETHGKPTGNDRVESQCVECGSSQAQSADLRTAI